MVFQTARSELSRKIPTEWQIPDLQREKLPRNVMGMFKEAGILTTRELEITESPDASSILEKIHGGTWTARDVTIAFCKRASLAQQLVNCLMDANFQGAIARAEELDKHFNETGKVVGPLHGLPISIKVCTWIEGNAHSRYQDLTAVAGMAYSIGFATWSDRKSTEDAVVVDIMRKAGAIVYVKTTMPQTGMASETTSHLWGRTLNPYNRDLTPGGSSGGEGALNACRGTPIGIATDVGGSIRGPAAFSGLYAIKPTSRRCPYLGNVIPAPGQIAIPSAIGPVAHSVRDIELICQIWLDAEPWRRDPSVVPMPWQRVETPKKATIGVMWWDGVTMPHPPIQKALKLAVEKLKAAGHEGDARYAYHNPPADRVQ